MHKTSFFAGFALFVCSTSVFAFGARTFVASNGLDSNTCGRTDPCRSFAAAMAQTADNGEIVALDSAGYGTIAITKPLSIIAPLGVHAAITGSTGDAIAINVGQFQSVALRNLYINSGGAPRGITFNTGSALHVEHCVISGFSRGINLIPTTDANVSITDTMLRQDFFAAIVVDSANALQVIVDHCQMEHGGNGVLANAGKVAVSNSTADGGTGSGFAANGGPVAMIVESCTASHQNIGVLSQAGGSVLVHNSAVLNNDVGYYALGGDMQIDNSVASANTVGVDVNAGVASITACTIANNTTFGVRVQNFGHAQLIRNTITRNDVGVDCTGGTAKSTGDNAIDENITTNVNCVFGTVNQA